MMYMAQYQSLLNAINNLKPCTKWRAEGRALYVPLSAYDDVKWSSIVKSMRDINPRGLHRPCSQLAKRTRYACSSNKGRTTESNESGSAHKAHFPSHHYLICNERLNHGYKKTRGYKLRGPTVSLRILGDDTVILASSMKYCAKSHECMDMWVFSLTRTSKYQ
jgi:hypothetical protein